MLYAIRQIGKKDYDVVAFGDHDIPEKSYEIRGRICSCPAHVPYCKHLRMLDENVDAGLAGLFVDEDSGTTYRLPMSLIDMHGNLTREIT